MSKPMSEQIGEDLHYANELGGMLGYAYEGDRLIVQEYSDEGEVVARYPLTITVGDPLPAIPQPVGDTETPA